MGKGEPLKKSRPTWINMRVTEILQYEDVYFVTCHNDNMKNALYLVFEDNIPHIGDHVTLDLKWRAKKYSKKRHEKIGERVLKDKEIPHICENCIHFNRIAGMARTGVCDANELNRRVGVPVVLTSSEETCWQWERDREMI